MRSGTGTPWSWQSAARHYLHPTSLRVRNLGSDHGDRAGTTGRQGNWLAHDTVPSSPGACGAGDKWGRGRGAWSATAAGCRRSKQTQQHSSSALAGLGGVRSPPSQGGAGGETELTDSGEGGARSARSGVSERDARDIAWLLYILILTKRQGAGRRPAVGAPRLVRPGLYIPSCRLRARNRQKRRGGDQASSK